MAKKIYIPNDPMLYQKLISELHDSSGHPGPLRKLANLKRLFFWPGTNQTVKKSLQTMSNMSCYQT